MALLCVLLSQELSFFIANKAVILPSTTQLKLLPDELKTHQWGEALLDATYALVRKVREQKLADGHLRWKPKLKVPDMRFAEAGLVVEQGNSNRARIYMVEERIGGEYKKYIHNATARLPASAQTDSVALFLAFSQHAQYIMSNGMAFVSDYQGASLALVFFV